VIPSDHLIWREQMVKCSKGQTASRAVDLRARQPLLGRTHRPVDRVRLSRQQRSSRASLPFSPVAPNRRLKLPFCIKLAVLISPESPCRSTRFKTTSAQLGTLTQASNPSARSAAARTRRRHSGSLHPLRPPFNKLDDCRIRLQVITQAELFSALAVVISKTE